MLDFTPPPLGQAWAVRLCVMLHVAAVAVQVAAAIAFVGGLGEMYELHRTNAWVVLGLGVVQAAAIIALAVRGMGRYFTIMAVLIPLGEALQIHLGRGAETAWHVSLAMLIWAFSVALLIRVANPAWAPKAQAAT